MKIFTIGFTKKSAEEFFTRLQDADVRRVLDIRLNNTSQLAGFAKACDLEYFLKAIAGMGYVHVPELTPTQALFDAFVKDKCAWSDYERVFVQLLDERRVAETLSKKQFDGACLLCSEDSFEHCHRRLVAEYLQEKWGGVEIVHL